VRYSLLNILEDPFDAVGQVIELGGFGKEGRFRESIFSQYFS